MTNVAKLKGYNNLFCSKGCWALWSKGEKACGSPTGDGKKVCGGTKERVRHCKLHIPECLHQLTESLLWPHIARQHAVLSGNIYSIYLDSIGRLSSNYWFVITSGVLPLSHSMEKIKSKQRSHPPKKISIEEEPKGLDSSETWIELK